VIGARCTVDVKVMLEQANGLEAGGQQHLTDRIDDAGLARNSFLGLGAVGIDFRPTDFLIEPVG